MTTEQLTEWPVTTQREVGTLPLSRLRRVTDRIRAIHLAEQGATFVDVFERLRGDGRGPEEAYATCVRVFRGSTPEGGPFTKDLAYSKGFVMVYNFIRLAVRRGRLERIPLLFCGKLDLADVVARTVPLDADAVNQVLDELEHFGGAVRTVIEP